MTPANVWPAALRRIPRTSRTSLGRGGRGRALAQRRASREDPPRHGPHGLDLAAGHEAQREGERRERRRRQRE